VPIPSATGPIATLGAFLPAVVLIALVWGRGPAVAAALGSAILAGYLLLPPALALSVPISEGALLLAGLLAVAVGLGTLTDRMRRVQRDLRDGAAGDRIQETLLSSVSHNLKTPLTAIIGSLGTLLTEDRNLGERSQQDLVAIAYEEAQQLDRLVAQFLEMTRVETGVLPGGARGTDPERTPASAQRDPPG
jgi:two-component system, OmpR family, sensor histidine kinase KdpD